MLGKVQNRLNRAESRRNRSSRSRPTGTTTVARDTRWLHGRLPRGTRGDKGDVGKKRAIFLESKLREVAAFWSEVATNVEERRTRPKMRFSSNMCHVQRCHKVGKSHPNRGFDGVVKAVHNSTVCHGSGLCRSQEEPLIDEPQF